MKTITPYRKSQSKKSNGRLITYIGDNNTNGIIDYLEKQYGANIHDQGIITISASSTHDCCDEKPEQVINYNWSSYWRTKQDKPGEWWEINFKKMKVQINGYFIKTFEASSGCAHLKNWVIEGRNEGEDWKEIDRRENNFDLNGPSNKHYYSIPQMTKPYQYIRIKCIGKTHYNTYHLLLTNFEVYGIIHEN